VPLPPPPSTSYSIQQHVEDLDTVLSQIEPFTNQNKPFHLYGHSFGGVLAFEYALRRYSQHQPRPLRSLVLSNSPTNMRLADEEYGRLEAKNPLAFWHDHACRVGIPPALGDAFRHTGKVWIGMDVVIDYAAERKPPTTAAAAEEGFPPTLVVSGSCDFGYEVSNEDAWRAVLPDGKLREAFNFDSGRHYPFYEDPVAYGRVVEGFLSEIEGAKEKQ